MLDNNYYRIAIPTMFTFRTAPALNEETQKSIDLEYKSIVFDMGTCNFIDSSMIGMMTDLVRRCREIDRQVILLKPSKTVIDLLTINNILQYFKIFYSDSELKNNISTNSNE